jgi:hypothetical protein
MAFIEPMTEGAFRAYQADHLARQTKAQETVANIVALFAVLIGIAFVLWIIVLIAVANS